MRRVERVSGERADVIQELILDEELRQSGECKVCLLKNRMGEPIQTPVLVPVDHRYASIGDEIEGFASPVSAGEVNMFAGDEAENFNLENLF